MDNEQFDEVDCPLGCGSMVLYESEDDDDRESFYECPDCGHSEDA